MRRFDPSPVRYVPTRIVARILCCSEDYVTRLCRRGEIVHRALPGTRLRRRYLVATDAMGWPIESPEAAR